MSISLYDLCVPTYLQILRSTANVLDKGAAYAAENDIDPADFVETRLRDDMLPLRFQVMSTAHHSLGTLKAMETGVFSPPSGPDYDYAGLQGLIAEAISGVEACAADTVNGYSGKDLTFQMGKFSMPFTVEGFVQSFSLPNFYFHATTTYDILRMRGVPLGKMDFLGAMQVKS